MQGQHLIHYVYCFSQWPWKQQHKALGTRSIWRTYQAGLVVSAIFCVCYFSLLLHYDNVHIWYVEYNSKLYVFDLKSMMNILQMPLFRSHAAWCVHCFPWSLHHNYCISCMIQKKNTSNLQYNISNSIYDEHIVQPVISEILCISDVRASTLHTQKLKQAISSNFIPFQDIFAFFVISVVNFMWNMFYGIDSLVWFHCPSEETQNWVFLCAV